MNILKIIKLGISIFVVLVASFLCVKYDIIQIALKKIGYSGTSQTRVIRTDRLDEQLGLTITTEFEPKKQDTDFLDKQIKVYDREMHICLPTQILFDLEAKLHAMHYVRFHGISTPDYKTSIRLGIFVRDRSDAIVGGCYGKIWPKAKIPHIHIHFVWVHPKLRSLGIAKTCIRKAEEIAKIQNCKMSRLETCEYQAPEFYKKMGYDILDLFPN